MTVARIGEPWTDGFTVSFNLGEGVVLLTQVAHFYEVAGSQICI